MTENEVLERVSKVFKKVLETDEFNINMDINNVIGWESLRQISLITELEKEFNISFDYTEITEMTSVKNIIGVIAKH